MKCSAETCHMTCCYDSMTCYDLEYHYAACVKFHVSCFLCSHDDAYVTVITQLPLICSHYHLDITRGPVHTNSHHNHCGYCCLSTVHLVTSMSTCSSQCMEVSVVLGGGAGSVIALLAHAYPHHIGADKKFGVLGIAMILLFIIGLIWYWSKLAPKRSVHPRQTLPPRLIKHQHHVLK